MLKQCLVVFSDVKLYLHMGIILKCFRNFIGMCNWMHYY